jgi:hypothetical protein
MPLTAHRHIRKMRGGAQSHLLQTDDGRFYVVKFLNNPQHRRILVNELIAATFLDHLRIASPATALVKITPEFLEENPEVYLTLGTRRIPVDPGWHFGSRHPGDPAVMAVFDFLPDALLPQVANRQDFLGVLVFDKWFSNADGRQCIFYRRHIPGENGNTEWVAEMIDHGFVFNGPHWELLESAIQGVYARRSVYEGVRGWEDFQPWLDQAIHCPDEVMDRALRQIPPEWIAGEEPALDALVDRLWRRRARLPEILKACRDTKFNPFPNWT